MTPERWQYIKQLYHAALERDTDEQAAFLAEACAGDEQLRGEVESLLHCDARAELFIEAPALEVAARLQAEEQAAETFDTLLHTNSDSFKPGSGSSPVSPIFIGDHRIFRKLGEGGMGVVYEAEQQHPRRLVALKVIRGGRLVDEYQVRLFQREVQALARLKHPGIAAIYEAGRTDDGQHYFVMELVRGIPLLDYVKGRRLTGARAPSNIRRRLELFLKICEAISYAHQRGVIHRDLKPANILVADESEGQSLNGPSVSRVEIKVLDFGLARITDEDSAGASDLSQAGQIRGTLPYMSPEQVRGASGDIDVRTDVYALGVILYELLTERLPHDLEQVTLPQAIRIICEEAPKPLNRSWGKSRDRESRKTERIDRDIETIALKALEKEPGPRYRSAAAMAEDVTRYLTNQPIQARPPSALYQFRKLVARHKAPFALLAAVFALLLGFAITMAMLLARIASERDKAVAAERVAAEQRDAAEQARYAERDQRNAAEQARNAEREQRGAAEQARKAEQDQRLLAEANLNRAEAQELSNRRQLYVAQMNLAGRAWDALNLKQLRELVESNWLDPRRENLRGFEWYYYWQLYHHDRLTLQHQSGVLAVAFSPNGKHLATGDADGRLRLWDLASGRELATFSGHSKLIRSVAFSPDGSRIASASQDHTVRMWDIATGQGLLTLNGHTDQVCSVAFSHDGKLASGSFDRTVKIWDTMTGQEFITLKGHANWVWAITFSPDGRNLASASEDRTIKLWNIGDGREIRTLIGHTASVYAVAFSPDGAKLATGGYDRTAKLWEVATGRELATLVGHNLDVNSVVFSPDGGKLTTGSFDRTVKLWDLNANSEIAVIKGHDGIINSVAFSPNGRLLATCSDDYTAKLWDTVADQVPIITGHSKSVTSVEFSPDGQQLATGSEDYSLRLWEPSTGRQIARFTGLGGQIEAIAFSPDGRILALANGMSGAVLLNLSTGEKFFLIGHTDFIWDVAFSPDGRKLATAGKDSKIILWDVATRRQITTLEGHTAPIKSIAFSPDGALLASGSDDYTVKLWNTSSLRELVTLRGHRDQVFAVAFSPNGSILATGGVDRKIILWDVKSGRELNVLQGHEARIKAVIFSPDGKRLASGGYDQTVRLWETATGQELATLKGHTAMVNALAFSSDSRTLVSGSSDKTIRLWRAASEAEVRAVLTWDR